MLQLSKSLSRLTIRPLGFPVAGAPSAYLHTSPAAFLQISGSYSILKILSHQNI